MRLRFVESHKLGSPIEFMTSSLIIPRRRFLRGLGTLMSLPLLESVAPAGASNAVNGSTVASPRRLAFVYVPNGVNMADWAPSREGAEFELPPILEPLA